MSYIHRAMRHALNMYHLGYSPMWACVHTVAKYEHLDAERLAVCVFRCGKPR